MWEYKFESLELSGYGCDGHSINIYNEGAYFQAAMTAVLSLDYYSQIAKGVSKGVMAVTSACYYIAPGAAAPEVLMACSSTNCCIVKYLLTNCGDYYTLTVLAVVEDESDGYYCDPDGSNECFYECDNLENLGIMARLPQLKSDGQNATITVSNSSYTVPNPANNSVSIILNNTIKGSLVLKITNTEGKELFTTTKVFNNEEAKFVVDLTQLQSGTYFYTMTNNGDKVSDGKFIVVH
jgi:hypothetical protein